MGDVVNFTGITSLDLDPDRVLDDAKGKLVDVVVIGTHKDGSEYFAASISSGPEVGWMLDRAKLKLLQVVDRE